jgi:hypothetical protein
MRSPKIPLKFDVSLYIYGFILYVASLLITGYAVYIENQALQIPLVHLINNPALYPNDPFAETLPYYASTLWYLVALGNRLIPLEPLLLTFFLLERLLVIVAAGYLAHTFAPKSKLAIVGAMAVFALGLAGPTLGGNELVINYFEQTGLSIPFFLLAFAAFYRHTPWLVALWTAIGFNCNSMFGVYALTYMGSAFLLSPHYRQNWQRWSLAFALFLFLASPSILLTLAAFGRNASDPKLWYLVSQVRFPHHLFPLTWNKVELGKYFVLIFLLLTLLYQNRDKFEHLFQSCRIWAGVSLAWLSYAFFAAYIAKSPSMLVMHPGRGLTLWYGIASTALVSVCAVKLETTKGRLRRAFILGIFSASILIWHPIIGPYILALGLLAFALQPVWYYLLDRGSSRRIALLLTAWVLAVGMISFQSRWSQGKSLQDALIYRPAIAIEEIAAWAKDRTTLDSVFLTDLGLSWQQFRAQSQRPVFTNWKDGSAILWDRAFVKPWVERLKAVGFDITQKGLTLGKSVPQISQLYKKLGDGDVQKLQAYYKLDYWIVPKNQNSRFPTVFQNRAFKVLSLKEKG